MGQKQKPERFEDMLSRLEGIVRSLESDEIDLEPSLQAFEEGVRIVQACHARLDDAERRVEILRRGAGGTVTAEPFDPGPEG